MHVAATNEALPSALLGPGGAAYWRQCLRSAQPSTLRPLSPSRLWPGWWVVVGGGGLAAAWLLLPSGWTGGVDSCRIRRFSGGPVLCLRQMRPVDSIFKPAD